MGHKNPRAVEFSASAVVKVVLHGLKYPHLPVGGFLLCSSSTTPEDTITVLDAVPVFHGVCGGKLSPMLEMSFMLTDAYARKRNLILAGYYVMGDELPGSDPSVQVVAEKLSEQYSHAVVLTLNETCWRSMPPFIPSGEKLNVTQWIEGSPVSCPRSSISLADCEQMNAAISRCYADKRYNDLVDMDNHFDDVSRDWKNKNLNQEIHEMIQNQ